MNEPDGTQSIDVGGRRLTWRSEGSGPALMLVNGYAATNMDWDPSFVGALAESFEVVMPDHRGMGACERGEGPITIDGLAADVAALLDALGLERAPLVGWSMGGFVVQRLAHRATALALMSTDPGGAEAVPADPDVWARLTDHGGTPREQASRLLALLFPPDMATAVDAQFGDIVAAARAQLDVATLQDQEDAMAAWHTTEQPPPGDDAPPVLVIHGSEDMVIPPANADALLRRWPGAKLEPIAGGGHAFMAQEPARVADLLTRFFSSR